MEVREATALSGRPVFGSKGLAKFAPLTAKALLHAEAAPVSVTVTESSDNIEADFAYHSSVSVS